MLTPKIEKEARRLKEYFPFRRIWVVSGNGLLFPELIAEATAHRAGQFKRKGYAVHELIFGEVK